jgi:hypothetical protein
MRGPVIIGAIVASFDGKDIEGGANMCGDVKDAKAECK